MHVWALTCVCLVFTTRGREYNNPLIVTVFRADVDDEARRRRRGAVQCGRGTRSANSWARRWAKKQKARGYGLLWGVCQLTCRFAHSIYIFVHMCVCLPDISGGVAEVCAVCTCAEEDLDVLEKWLKETCRTTKQVCLGCEHFVTQRDFARASACVCSGSYSCRKFV